MSGQGGEQRRLVPPSDDEWALAIYTFRIFRSFEEAEVLKRARNLPGLLEADAAVLCQVADELDRTLHTKADLLTFRASEIVRRIELRGHGDDVFWKHVWNGLEDHLLEAVTGSPSALRQRAYALRNAADEAQRVLGIYIGYANELRRARGPPPSVAMYNLFVTIDPWRVSLTEIARRFVAAGVPQEGEPDESDPVQAWVPILKRARQRARELRANQGTG